MSEEFYQFYLSHNFTGIVIAFPAVFQLGTVFFDQTFILQGLGVYGPELFRLSKLLNYEPQLNHFITVTDPSVKSDGIGSIVTGSDCRIPGFQKTLAFEKKDYSFKSGIQRHSHTNLLWRLVGRTFDYDDVNFFGHGNFIIILNNSQPSYFVNGVNSKINYDTHKHVYSLLFTPFSFILLVNWSSCSKVLPRFPLNSSQSSPW